MTDLELILEAQNNPGDDTEACTLMGLCYDREEQINEVPGYYDLETAKCQTY